MIDYEQSLCFLIVRRERSEKSRPRESWPHESCCLSPRQQLYSISGANSHTVGNVNCHSNLTVDINITNVDNGWNTTVVVPRSNNSASCQPKSQRNGTVIFDGLLLPDCAWSSEQLNNSIKYTLIISVTKSKSRITFEYDQMYYVSCEYVNENKVIASFRPVRYRNITKDSGM